ncbi:MAG: copper homeostasis protein CutC [Gemmataceae bacterium]
MSRVLLEVCVETVADAVAAERGGADRLELCSALDLGGLTPTPGMYLAVRAAVRLPLVVMLRPRAGGFVYTADELNVILRDQELFRPHQPAGFVFGPLLLHQAVDREAVAVLRAGCGRADAVFHRAFDETPDPDRAVEDLIELNVTRVLTSGGAETAVLGAERIAKTVRSDSGRIQVLACGKVNATSANAVLDETRCGQLHGAFRLNGRTSERAVAEARQAVDQWADG